MPNFRTGWLRIIKFSYSQLSVWVSFLVLFVWLCFFPFLCGAGHTHHWIVSPVQFFQTVFILFYFISNLFPWEKKTERGREGIESIALLHHPCCCLGVPMCFEDSNSWCHARKATALLTELLFSPSSKMGFWIHSCLGLKQATNRLPCVNASCSTCSIWDAVEHVREGN